LIPVEAPPLSTHTAEGGFMAWKKPRVTEVSLALEINSYACAELG
jgi:coenzyme PQQ precursor peptide PqqA